VCGSCERKEIDTVAQTVGLHTSVVSVAILLTIDFLLDGFEPDVQY